MALSAESAKNKTLAFLFDLLDMDDNKAKLAKVLESDEQVLDISFSTTDNPVGEILIDGVSGNYALAISAEEF